MRVGGGEKGPDLDYGITKICAPRNWRHHIEFWAIYILGFEIFRARNFLGCAWKVGWGTLVRTVNYALCSQTPQVSNLRQPQAQRCTGSPAALPTLLYVLQGSLPPPACQCHKHVHAVLLTVRSCFFLHGIRVSVPGQCKYTVFTHVFKLYSHCSLMAYELKVTYVVPLCPLFKMHLQQAYTQVSECWSCVACQFKSYVH